MRVATLLVLACISAACSVDTAPLIARDVTVTKPLAGQAMSAGYLTLANSTDEAITITSVASPDYGSVEMHESSIENGIARMRPLESVTIPPDQAIAFEPGGRHLMLMRATGSAADVTLQFFSDDGLMLSVTAKVTE